MTQVTSELKTLLVVNDFSQINKSVESVNTECEEKVKIVNDSLEDTNSAALRCLSELSPFVM